MIGVTRGWAAADVEQFAWAVAGSSAAAPADPPAAPRVDAGVPSSPSTTPAAPSSVAAPPQVLEPSPLVPGASLAATSAPEARPRKPIVERWWFWTAIGAAVAAVAVTVLLVGRTPDRPACPTTGGYVCPP